MQFDKPMDLDDALDLLAESPDATLLAGGTDLMVEINFGHRQPDHVVALRRISALKESNSRFIGSGATWARLENHHQRALAQASRTVGSPQIRATGTIGGNLGTASPAGDGLPYLAAVDAEIELVSKSGSRKLSWHDFLTGPKQNALAPGEIILGVHLPDRLPDRQEFGKIGVRNAMVISTVMATVARFDDGETRVAVGSVGPTTLRAHRAEELASQADQPTDNDLAEFQRLVSEEVRPITDHRSTAEYRRHAAGVLARRLLERCLA